MEDEVYTIELDGNEFFLLDSISGNGNMYYYFSIKSQKYRVYKKKEKERYVGFKRGTFPLSLVTILKSCKPGILSGLHQGCSSKGNSTDS